MYRISPQLSEKIKHFATFPQTGVSLRQMVMFGQNPTQGTLFKASQFLSEELPIRLAHRVKELEELPHNLSDMPSIIRVKNWYAQSFQDLVEFPSKEMTPALKDLAKSMNRQSEMQALPENSPNLAMPNGNNQSTRKGVSLSHRYHTQGILEFKQQKRSHIVDTDVQAFLDRFYMSRIGIRMLIGQHIALNKGPSRKDYVGIICTKTNLADMAQEAIDNAKFICEDYYGLFRGPEVHLHCKKDLEFMYVPSHLSHMLFELLKNSLRAVVEQYGTECDEYPPIKLIVAQGKEDIAIKISDEGGGIPRSGVPLVWTYMYTTAPSQHLDPTFDKSDFKAPMAGFGYGLPISRLYARYFGGDLKLISMEGYGTDVYLHLNRISNSDEPLP
ncbi:hypothetical protein BGZ89_004148 [Linnemannia elongata]|nr:hypothetical protein BGZ89_004148 [Linnemannia elongata]